MKDFAGLLKSVFTASGKVFHNNKGIFIGLMEQCSDAKAKAILQTLDEYVREYNNLNPDYAIEYESTNATSNTDEVYSIRDLTSKAFEKLKD